MAADAPPTRRLDQRLAWLAGGAVVVAALALLWALDPAEGGPFPPCPLYALTGLSCAGCGVLRATHALLHGDVARAWDLNPLYVTALGLCPVGVALGSRRLLRPPVVAAALAILVVYTVVRNL